MNVEYTSGKQWYEVANIQELDTPALLFYPERIRENISIAKQCIGDVKRLRPHIKTHKCMEVTHLMLEAGITKFKCATIAEAEMLGMSHAPDVLLAYQPVSVKVNRFINLVKTYPDTAFSCLVDNIDSAAFISQEASKTGTTIPVFIDVNIGMDRTGASPADVMDLYSFCFTRKMLTVRGLHAYDGHIHATDLAERTKECEDGFSIIKGLIAEIQSSGYVKPVIVAGGTPTFPVFAKMEDVECSPGTFILWDEGYRATYPDLPFLNAAVVATRVISIPGPDTYCLDLGHKAISAENPLNKRVHFLNTGSIEFIGHSEEHLVIKTNGDNDLETGQMLYGLPIHICPTCALYDYANVVVGHQVVAEWKIQARTRKISI